MFLSNPRFVLALLAVSSYFGNFLLSVSAVDSGENYFMYGGYTSTTDVDATAGRDLIQKQFESELKKEPLDLCANLEGATEFFDDSSLKNIPTYDETNSKIFNIFSKFYKEDDYAKKWAQAALEEGEFFDNDFGDWGTMTADDDDEERGPCIGNVESAKKGTAYLSGLLEVNQYMEEAIEIIRKDDKCILQFDDCEDAIIAWNKAAAYFVGSLEGAKGVFESVDEDTGDTIPEKPYGKMLYALGDKRCRNFKKCGRNADSDSKDVPSKTNIVSIALFQKGAGFVFAGDFDSLEKTINEINAQILITVIQGSLRYGYRLGDYQETSGTKDRSTSAKELGEGATFASCAAPQLWAIDKKAGKIVSEQYQIGPKGPASKGEFDFVKVRTAFECNYEKLGISCDEVGALWDGESDFLSRQCTDPKSCKKRDKNSIPTKKECKPYTKKKNKTDFYNN